MISTDQLLQQVIEMQEGFATEQKNTASEFNIFQIAGIESKEVIMCRILYGLLVPNGTHGRGLLFLKLFIEQVLELSMTDDELSTAVVRREQVIKEERRIDLVIETRDRFIPIEVKIYAKDQYNQCLDYFNFANIKNRKKQSGKEWHIYYLTLAGNEPTWKSTDGNRKCIDNLRMISWGKSIHKWIVNVSELPEIIALPNIYEVVCQFGDAILKICGKSNRIISRRVTDMMGRDAEFMKAAKLIFENYQNACTKFLREFFEWLEKEIDYRLNQMEDSKLTKFNFFNVDKQLDGFYFTQKSTYPGLDYKIADLSDDYVMAVRIEVDWNCCCKKIA